MPFKSFQCVGRTGGLVSAIKSNPRAKYQPINPNWSGKNMRKCIQVFKCNFFRAVSNSVCITANLVVLVVLERPIKTYSCPIFPDIGNTERASSLNRRLARFLATAFPTFFEQVNPTLKGASSLRLCDCTTKLVE